MEGRAAMTMYVVRVRPATQGDLQVLGRLGASLMRAHHAYDRNRFMAPGTHPEQGYARFLGSQLDQPGVAIFVAEDDGGIAGYVYAGVEPISWKELRDECGYVHDLVVDESRRGRSVGTALMEAALAWMTERGLPRVVLWTAQRNETAQRLFDRLGFRRTMIEMTKEL
jgi:ribosomal protein S18 acetylase RimI-like enzyme